MLRNFEYSKFSVEITKKTYKKKVCTARGLSHKDTIVLKVSSIILRESLTCLFIMAVIQLPIISSVILRNFRENRAEMRKAFTTALQFDLCESRV